MEWRAHSAASRSGGSGRFLRAPAPANYSPPGKWRSVAPRGRFRAVSLDLWFTSLYYRAEVEHRWEEDRVRALGEVLRSRSGERIDPAAISAAIEAVHSKLRREGSNTGKVDPQALVTWCAEALGAQLVVGLADAGRSYSAAGLAEHPPEVNPELPEVVAQLSDRGIPVIAITNTARRGETWREFFRSRGLHQFRDIVASCEVGRAKPDPEIFQVAARRLGLPLPEILHVGDRWELDVEGARRAGCGAMLYTGLWSQYPPGMYPKTDTSLLESADVMTIERLDQLLADGLFASPR
jgi:HAD superfamily hydrolase (TIGR01509 family)